MPQYDRRRDCEVPIEYEQNEKFVELPTNDRVSLVLLTDGKVNMTLNSIAITATSPSVLCLSEQDTLDNVNNNRVFAQSFHLSPSYLKNRQTFKQIKKRETIYDEKQYAQDVLSLFYYRDENYKGILHLTPQSYIRIFEWMSIIGTEIQAQSDGRWTCRVRAYFMMVLNMLDEVYANREASPEIGLKDSPVDIVMEFIHNHYMEELTLDMLCKLVHINRTSLSERYKKRTGQNVMEYLHNYRLRVAQELMAHTGLTLDEIARQTGFGYDTYLIRRFTTKTGMSPSEYRKQVRELNGIIILKQ